MIKRKTTVRTNPMLALTVFCWSSMGYILGNKHRRFFFLTPVLILNGWQISFLLYSGEKLEMLILNLYFSMLFFNTWVSLLNFIGFSFSHEKQIHQTLHIAKAFLAALFSGFTNTAFCA